MDIEDRGGPLELLVPYATLEPARDLLLQMFMGEKFGRDSIWENHLARQILVTGVELEAVLEEQTIRWRGHGPPGRQHPAAERRPDAMVILRCGHVPLLRGRIGRIGEHIAIRIEGRPGEEGRR